MNNKISVIIPTFNGYKYIDQAINSVLSQTYNGVEIIVVDDGSDDPRLKDVLNYYIDNRLITYLYKDNGGQGSARNEGIKISSNEYVAFLDDDDYWREDKLEKQLKLMEENIECIVSYTDFSIINTKGEIENKTVRNLHSPFYRGLILNKIVFKNFITLSSSLIRKDFLLKNKLFNEDKELIRLEDYDLWLSLSAKCKFNFINEPLVFYRIKFPLTTEEKIIEYKKLLSLFEMHLFGARFKQKIWYLLGWSFYFIKFTYFSAKNIL